MPSYMVHAVNVGSFLLGEADKVLTLFTAEKGLVRAVAKSARKPGTKMAGRSDVLAVNKLLLSSGRTFEIITQAETIDSFPEFRLDLSRLSYGLYYAELTQHFGTGLADEPATYFDYLCRGLRLQARSQTDPGWLSLEYQLGLLDMLGYRPELTYCVLCREVLGEYNVSLFNRELGGILCLLCSKAERRNANQARERSHGGEQDIYIDPSWREGSEITPLVWKNMVLAIELPLSNEESPTRHAIKPALQQSVQAAHRLTRGYIEHRAGRRMKALDLVEQIK